MWAKLTYKARALDVMWQCGDVILTCREMRPHCVIIEVTGFSRQCHWMKSTLGCESLLKDKPIFVEMVFTVMELYSFLKVQSTQTSDSLTVLNKNYIWTINQGSTVHWFYLCGLTQISLVGLSKCWFSWVLPFLDREKKQKQGEWVNSQHRKWQAVEQTQCLSPNIRLCLLKKHDTLTSWKYAGQTAHDNTAW